MSHEVKLSDTNTVLYLNLKRPDPTYNHKWQGFRLLELHTPAKVMSKIEKHKDERLFVKVSTKREIVCSVVVDEVVKNEDGTFTVKMKEIREDSWVLPGAIRSFAGGFAEGPPPIPVPVN